MGLFRKSRSVEEGQELRRLAARGTLDEFLASYRAADATDPELGTDLLFESVRNKDIAARTGIATRLLDDGADATAERRGLGILHQLLTYGVHDFPAEVPLLQRLLAEGADVNRVDPRTGTPLEALAAQFKFSDDQLAPFYDVLLTDPRLDPLQDSVFGRTVLGNVRNWRDGRPQLVARLEQLLADRGVAVPPYESA
ncbi:hypothetical protein [Nocardioides sp. SYSU DS0651]|uniref:hypothetical protein n=1 Tax=Nocardioides sp. SYSU DS0651 TaxID=3415955 RepID=UPI003F4B7BED